MIEVLIAALIIGISITGMARFWATSFRMNSLAANQGIAYSIARSAIEQVRQAGFTAAAEGSSTVYFDADGTFPPSATQVSTSVFSVTTAVISDKFTGAVPANDALRTVTVTVNLLSGGQTIYQTITALARAGI